MSKKSNVNPNEVNNVSVDNNSKTKGKKIGLKIFLIFLLIILAIIVGIAAGIIRWKWIK